MTDTQDMNWYYGSKLLEPLCSKVGLPLDQVNFLWCQLLVLLAGYPYRTWLSPDRVSSLLRHLVQISVGFSLCLFCFGVQVLHYLMICLVCYVLMMVLKPGVMEKVVFVTSMGYLAVMHIYRQIYDYGGYTLDITGPLMIAVQKLSSLAFSLRDGSVKDVSKLSENMKQKAVETFPNLVEFFSYMLCFHGLMCGPFCFYKDYIEFIDGTNYTKHENRDQNSTPNGSVGRREKKTPSPLAACVSTFTQSAVCAGICAYFLPKFSVMFIKTAAFDALGFIPKMLYIVVSTTLHRTKYYFAWKLGELVNANSGLGFNGYDSAGKSKWDLLCNADIFALETCTSLKIFLDKWNITTTHWLRYVVYERLHSTLAVFLFSAFWHGYYPGYYITFLGGAFFIHTGRLVRRSIRPWFARGNGPLLWLYHLLTYTATRLSTCYLVYPHVLLEFWPAIHSYRQIYFCMHIAAILITVVLTFAPKPRDRKAEATKKTD